MGTHSQPRINPERRTVRPTIPAKLETGVEAMNRSLFVHRAKTIAFVVGIAGAAGAVLALIGNLWTIYVSGQPVPLDTWITSMLSDSAEAAFLGLMFSFLFMENPRDAPRDPVPLEPVSENERR